MKRLACCFAILLICQMTWAQTESPRLEIALKHNDDRERRTKQQLRRFLATYDLSRWLFTTKVVIDSDPNVIPHSHPVLTLNTRHLKDDDLLLSTFVHEQLHWFFTQKSKETEEAVKELKTSFPKVPVGFPEGARNEESTYLHILVCYLEHQANKELLGELKARQVIEFWKLDHYTWIYKTVSEQERTIGAILRKHNLFPPRRA